MTLMIMPRDGFVSWYIYIYMLLHNDLIKGHVDLMMLRSTMSSYGWPVLEVAYGETLFSLHWGCIGVDSPRRVVGVSTWCIAHVWHTRVNTSVSSVYIIFWFSTYQSLCVCIMFSKSICSTKEHWWSLISS